jgi:formyltetrahydrofolate deformylase
LADLLYRHRSGELACDIALIIGNHATARPLADFYGIPFHVIEVKAATKHQAEAEQLGLLRQHNVDFVVLARYMQILSSEFVAQYPWRIINVHHSFLPALSRAVRWHIQHRILMYASKTVVFD